MCRSVLVFAALSLAACHSDLAPIATMGPGAGSAAVAPPIVPDPGSGSAVASEPTKPPEPMPPPEPKEPPPPPGFDFTAIARELLVVGACANGDRPETMSAARLEKHCEVIKKTQADYVDKWVKPARAFFADKVPSNLPKKVVYPFAGGDLSTALTVYPDADEITTMSLEPAGDPRTLSALTAPPIAAPIGKSAKPEAAKPDKPQPRSNPKLDKALATIEYELKFLYRVNFSNTLNMIEAMRGGQLPTQLVFGLSALTVHGYEVVSLRYFRIEEDGSLHYLDDAEVAAAPDPSTANAEKRNRIFANAEVRFRKPGGRIQVYRHIQVNLDNEHLKADPRVVKHLEAKGPVAGMTKAASYLLSWESFSIMRGYLLDHIVWMVSDATGIAPKWGKAKGFEYETYGSFVAPHIAAGNGVAKDWRSEFDAQGKRALAFRFGYYDKRFVNHLIIMRKKP